MAGRSAGHAAPASGTAVREETKSLRQLHDEAKAEGGTLVVYAGGDTPAQQDGNKAGSTPPRGAADLLDPRWKGRLVSTFPNDDDAVLYLYKLIVDKYGWDWLRKFAAQDVAWVRGTQEPADRVEAGTASVALGTDGGLVPGAGVKTRFVVPAHDPFMAWAQRAAILAGARHPAAAKLYLN